MSRPIRIEYPGAIYYVTSRTPKSVIAFRDDRDRVRFLDILAQTIKRSQWICHGYCLMEDHYHLIIETPKGNLSQGMRQVNGIYTQEYNRRYFKKGALFKGRFKTVLFDKEENLQKLARHVVLNPIRLNLADYASQYRWSSYKATAGLAEEAAAITTSDWILAQFGESQQEAQQRYQDYVNEAQAQTDPWRAVRYQLLLGSKEFIDRHKEFIGEPHKAKTTKTRVPLEQLFSSDANKSREMRDRDICQAHLQHGYTLTEVGRHLGLHTSTVSKILKKQGV
ncbi:MAG: transposase [Proteobacteria bacterium]|nr:transposase [Pseudomonadota bacterium]